MSEHHSIPIIHFHSSDFENGILNKEILHEKMKNLPTTLHWLKENQLKHEAEELLRLKESKRVIQPPKSASMVHITSVELEMN